MTDRESFMPFVSFALIAGGGVFGGFRNWYWGALSVPAGVVLILAAVSFAVVLALVAMNKLTGEFMLIPAGLTFIGMLLHCINMIMIKGSYNLRIEMLLAVLFVAMVLIMVASLTGRKGLDHKKATVICAVICAVSLFACFMPLVLSGMVGRPPVEIFLEIVETNLPLILYFAAFLTYFIAVKTDGGAA